MTFKAFCATICFTALSLAGCNDPVRISVPPLVLSIVPDTPTLAVGQTREYRITLVSGMLGLEDRVVDWSIRDTLIATRTTSTDTSVMIRGRSLGTTLLIARSRIRGSADTLELVVHPDTVRPPGVLVPWSTLQGQLAYSVEDSLFVLDPVKRERRLIARAAASTTLSPVSWSPDGVRLAAVVFGAGTATQTRIFDARDGTQVQALDGARCPSWTRDGRLSYMRGDTMITEGRSPFLVRDAYSCPSWSADGEFVIASIVDTVEVPYKRTSIYRIDRSTGARTLLIERATGGFSPVWYSPTISPNGQQFAYIWSTDGGVFDLRLASLDGSNRRSVPSTPRYGNPSWSPDGARVAASSSLFFGGGPDSRGLYFIDIPSGTMQKVANHPVGAIAWGPSR